MPAQNHALLTSGSVAAATTGTIASITLPENTLILIDVETHHATSASLATPTLSNAAFTTFTQIASVDTGGGTPTRRLTRFRCQTSSDVTGTITITGNGIAQTSIAWTVHWFGGVIVGSNGAAATGTTASYTSGTSSVTTVPSGGIALGPAVNAHSAYFAGFISSNAGAVTPRVNWTETADFQPTGAVAIRYQSQYTAVVDTLANGIFGSGVLAGLVTEIVCIPNPVAFRLLTRSFLVNQTVGTAVISTVLLAGRSYYMIVCVDGQFTPSVVVSAPPGITFTTLLNTTADGATVTDTRVQILRIVTDDDFDVSTNITITFGGFGAGYHYSYNIIEAANLDYTVNGTGEVQSASFAGSGASSYNAPLPVAASSVNALLLISYIRSASNSNTPGYQTVSFMDSSAGAHSTNSTTLARISAESAPNLLLPASNDVAGIVIELQQAPVIVPGVPPVVTLISPPEASPLPASTPAIIRAEDPDGDLVSYLMIVTLPTLGVSEVAWNGTAFTPLYSGSSRSATGTGFQNSVLRNSGWPDSTVQITTIAFDSEGNITDETFAWFVDFPDPPAAPESTNLDVVSQNDPARDIYLDVTTNNIALTVDGDLALVGGIPSIVQDCRQSLRMVTGEWFLDEEQGVPWLNRPDLNVVGILGQKAPSIPALREVFRESLLAVAGVLDVTSLGVILDSVTRRLNVTFSVTTDLGELVETLEVGV